MTTTLLTPTISIPGSAAAVTLRPIGPDDAPEAARILFAAFAGIHDRHAFARDFPTLEDARALVDAFIAHPAIWGVVAEVGGRIAGTNFLDERAEVAGVGPITVDPDAQAAGVGRLLMEAVLERGRDARGVRLLQDAFNTASLALYTSLGFDAREPVVVLAGEVATGPPAGVVVRPLEERDLPRAAGLARRVLGYDRTAELRDALAAPHMTPLVAMRDGRVVAYATTLKHFALAHAVGECDDDLRALLACAGTPVSVLLPSRQSGLLRWSLASGLRIVKPMTYMTTGEWSPPRGAWIPSVLL